jgi:hypothetical protein
MKEQHLFAPGKIAGLLEGGLEEMDAGERQLMLVMAETKLQEGYQPTTEEKQVLEKLRALAGDDYDARDIKRKVRTMVRSRSKPNTSPLKLPPMFDSLVSRFRRPKKEETD